MKKILLLLAMIFCSLIIGAEEIREGYCEGRGEILEKDFDYPDLSIVTTYDTCVINDVEYSNIKVAVYTFISLKLIMSPLPCINKLF